MPRCRTGSLFTNVCVLAVAAALAACSHAEAVNQQPAAQTAAQAPAPSPAAAPITREKASTDCWMKYEKEGRGLSLDRRLPLVEKCTAEKLKAAAR
jgi:hypothetical protein